MNKSTAVDDNPCLKLDISRHGMLNNTNLKLYPGTSDWSFRSTGEDENEEKLEILFITGIQFPVQCASKNQEEGTGRAGEGLRVRGGGETEKGNNRRGRRMAFTILSYLRLPHSFLSSHTCSFPSQTWQISFY